MAEEKIKKPEEKFSQEKIAQILAQGTLLTMEDDLGRLEKARAAEKAAEGIPADLKKRLEEFRKEAGEVPEKPEVAAPKEPEVKPPATEEEGLVEEIRRRAIAEKERREQERITQEKERETEKEKRRQETERAAQLREGAELKELAPLEARPPERVPLERRPLTGLARKRAPAFLVKKEEREAVRRKLQKEKREILTTLRTFPAKKRPFQERRKKVEVVLQSKEKALGEIFKNEKEIEAQQKTIEVQEAKAETVEKRHSLERKRWLVEQKRREIEKEKWAKEEEVDKLREEERRAGLVLRKILGDQQVLERKREKAVKGLRAIDLQEEREELGGKLVGLRQERKAFEFKRTRCLQQKKDLEMQVRIAQEHEKAVELEQSELEKRERGAPLKEQRQLEQQRWQVEAKREETEKKRWFLEKDLKNRETRAAAINKEYQELSSQEKKLRSRIDRIEAMLGYVPASLEAEPLTRPEEEVAEKVPEKGKVPELEEKEEEKKMIREIQWRARAQEQERLVGKLKARQEERMIEEIRQRAEEEQRERLRKLKEIQERARRDKESKETAKAKGPVSKEAILKRLTQVSPKEEAERRAFLARVAGKERPLFKVQEKEWETEVVFRPMVKKPSLLQKIVIRVLISLLVVGLAAGGYLLLRTYIVGPEPPQPSPSVPIEGPEEPVEPEPVEPVEPAEIEPTEPEPIEPEPAEPTEPVEPEPAEPPPSLIEVSETMVVDITTSTEVSLALLALSQGALEKGAFIRILFKDVPTKKFLEVAAVFSALEKDFFSADVYSGIATTTLFIHSSEGGNRFGFIAKVKPENNLISAFKLWESVAEESTENLMAILGQEGPALVHNFRTARHKGIGFRYQTFSKQDLGICYLITDEELVFTTSFEAMEKVIDILTTSEE